MSNSSSQQITFTKMSGAGNDFILVDGAANPIARPGELARTLCPRRTSVGGDGLITVEPSQRSDAHVRVRFYNPDGQETETCGNGTRCAARFAVIEGLAPAEMLIETAAGDIEASVSGTTVSLRYRPEPSLSLDLQVGGAQSTRRAHLVWLGVPHLVVPVERLPDGPIEATCRPLRQAPELGAAGANVNLVEVVDPHRIRIRTFERGVEGETLACGSGSLSSAVALSAAGRLKSPVTVETRSGDLLIVRFRRRNDGGFHGLELEGPARIIYRGDLAGSDFAETAGSHATAAR
ncbi:MAG: diaminopimelate epimerase [Gemmatimonadota bacterium]|nr:MAG: diaminopimelate epimerase [Gemmatimonadota bacterium]